MMGMPERISREDIVVMDDYFKGHINDGVAFETLKKKIELLRKQDEIAADASAKITALQDEIYSLYRKDVESNVEEKEEK